MLRTKGSALLAFEEPVAGLASLHRVEQAFWKPGQHTKAGLYGDLLLFADTPKQQLGAIMSHLALPEALQGLEMKVRVWRTAPGVPATAEQLQGEVNPYPPLDAQVTVFHSDSSLVDFFWNRMQLAAVHLHRDEGRWRILVLFNDRSPISIERVLRSLVDKFIDDPVSNLDVTIYKGKLTGQQTLLP